MEGFNQREQKALDEYCQRNEMSEQAAVRHLFRLGHFAEEYLRQGMEICFSRDGDIIYPMRWNKLSDNEEPNADSKRSS